MSRMVRRCLPVLLPMLILLAALAHAQQPTSGISLPGDSFVSEDLQVPAPGGGRGDPFGSGLKGDPFADDPAFLSEPDNGADKKNPEIVSMRQSRFNLHGYLESRNRIRAENGEAMSTRQRLFLEIDAAYIKNSASGIPAPFRFYGSGVLDIDPAAADISDDNDDVRLYPEEIYLTLDTTDLDVILGRKMLRWGMGDGINPMDLINPPDHRDPFASGRADTRIPVLLCQAVWQLPTLAFFQETSLEGVFIPLARVYQLPAPGSDWESPGIRSLREAHAQGLLVLNGQDKPDAYFRDGEFGLRLAATFSGWDLALIGFYGYVDSPVFERSTVAVSENQKIFHITPIHPAFKAIGINFAKGLERSTFRGELALKPDLPVMLKDSTAVPGYERHCVYECVLGLDRNFGTNLYTNLQYFFTAVNDAQGLAMDSFDHGITYEINDKFFNDDLKAGIRGIASFSGQGWTCEPYVEYKLGDNLLLAVSALFFQGSENGHYGQFTNNDAFTFRIRYSF
jgi:hypothetical protein